MSDPRSRLPNMNAVLADPSIQDLPRDLCKDSARRILAELRSAVTAGSPVPGAVEVAARVAAHVGELLSGRHRPVINATGVVLHTNLGRAPWAPEARAAGMRAMGYGNVELDLASGKRGGRLQGLAASMNALTGAEDAIVVNNCAAGVLLALTALARDHEVLVSRGELVEIGGSFRVPDVIASGGARLAEVGTTNRTRLSDYEAGITEHTAVLLKVHRSNFRVVGFTEEPDIEDMVALARARGLHCVYDLGSGAMDGWGDEPSLRRAIRSGVDLAIFSGDKLLGGPQAGILAGRREVVQRCRRHPLYRALRVDKVSLAALEATLALHLRGQQTPVARMLGASLEALQERAEHLCQAFRGAQIQATVAVGESRAGGGSLPGEGLESRVVEVVVEDAERVHRALRLGDPAVVARVHRGRLVFDVRTLEGVDPAVLVGALTAATMQR